MESQMEMSIYVFMFATFIGIGVIRRVSRLLHTPLMSLTNAISAIAVVGSIDHVPRTPAGGLGVVDWKTNRRAKPRRYVAGSLQLAIYALAYKEAYGVVPQRLELRRREDSLRDLHAQHLGVFRLALSVRPAHEPKRAPFVRRDLAALEPPEHLHELVDVRLVCERQTASSQDLRVVNCSHGSFLLFVASASPDRSSLRVACASVLSP